MLVQFHFSFLFCVAMQGGKQNLTNMHTLNVQSFYFLAWECKTLCHNSSVRVQPQYILQRCYVNVSSVDYKYLFQQLCLLLDY